MIDNRNNPVAWAMLLYNLDDARDHLATLIEKMNESGSIDEEDFRIRLGHIYSHLNCAWNGRNNSEEPNAVIWEEQSRFPTDVEPV